MDSFMSEYFTQSHFLELLNFVERECKSCEVFLASIRHLTMCGKKSTWSWKTIVFGVILATSFDEFIYKTGIEIIEKYTSSLTSQETDIFLGSLETSDNFVRDQVITILDLLYIQITFPVYLHECISNLANDQFPYDRKEIFFVKNSRENTLLQEIKKIPRDENAKALYKTVILKHIEELNAYVVTETLVHLSNAESIPHVLCYILLKEIVDLNKNEDFVTIDSLFWFRKKITLTGYRNLLKGFFFAYQRPLPLPFFLKYRLEPSFLVNFFELALTDPSIVSLAGLKPDLIDLSTVYKDSLNNSIPTNFKSLQFVYLVLFLSEKYPEKISKFIKNATNYYDYIFMGILQQPHFQLNECARTILHELIIYYIKNEINGNKFLLYAWNTVRETEKLRGLILRSLQEYFCQSFSDSSDRISRVFNIASNLKAVGVLLKTSSLAFSLELAMYANGQNQIFLDQWLVDKYSEHKQSLIPALIAFIQKHYPLLFEGDPEHNQAEVFRIKNECKTFDKVLFFIHSKSSLLSPEIARKAEELYANYKSIMSFVPQRTNSDSNLTNHAAKFFFEIIDRVNSTKGLNAKREIIDNIIVDYCLVPLGNGHSLLFKTLLEVATNYIFYSYVKKSDLFSLNLLLHRFFSHDLLDAQAFLEILKNVLDSTNHKNPLFYLVIFILAHNQILLHASREFAQTWLEAPFFNHFPPFIRFAIENVAHQTTIPLIDGVVFPFEDPHYVCSFEHPDYLEIMLEKNNPKYREGLLKHDFTYKIKPDALVLESEGKIEEGDQYIRNFIDLMNESNVIETANQINEFWNPNGLKWLCWYLVRYHIMSRPNHYQLFKNFLKLVDRADLYQGVRAKTVYYIRLLLSTINNDSSPGELEILNNLGFWFGIITIGDNKPVMGKELCFKFLLVEAGFKGQDDITRVLNFVRGFLSCVSDNRSIIFNASNPFILSILSVLAEIHRRFDIRSNLKLEIEMIARFFNTHIKCVPPSDYLVLNDFFDRLDLLLPWTDSEKEIVSFKIKLKNTNVDYETLEDFSASTLENLLDKKTVPNLYLADILNSVWGTIKEISDWLFKIVCKPFTEMVDTIVTEDFRTDPDQNHLMYGAHTMAKSVSLSYAYVLITQFHFDNIVSLMKHNIRGAMVDHAQKNQRHIELEFINRIAYYFLQDNIDLLCAFIGKHFIERVVPEIDRTLLSEYENRQAVADDYSRFIPRPPLITVPDSIAKRHKMHPSSPTPQQMSVYNEFNKHMPMFSNFEKKQSLEKQLTFQDTSDKVFIDNLSEQAHYFTFDLFKYYTMQLYKIVENCRTDHNYSSVNQLLETMVNTVFFSNMRLFPTVIKCTLVCFFEFIHKQKFNDDPNYQLIIDHTLELLLSLEDTKKFKKYLPLLVTRTVLDFNHDFRNNLKALVSLISKRLIIVKNLDTKIAQSLGTEKSDSMLNFPVEISKSLFRDHTNLGIACEYEFSQTLDIFNRVSTNMNASKTLLTTLKPTILESSANKEVGSVPEGEQPDQNKWLTVVLRQMIRITYSDKVFDNNTNFKIISILLAKYGILKNEETLLLFIKNIFDFSCNLFNGQNNDFDLVAKVCQVLDAFIPFIILLVKFYSAPDVVCLPMKMNFFCKILNLIYSQMTLDASNQNKKFCFFIYEKVCIGLIGEIARPDTTMDSLRQSYMSCLVGFFHSINPSSFPIFAHSFFKIVSNTDLIRVSLANDETGKLSSYYLMLICDILQFIYPYINDQVFESDVVKKLFKKLVSLFHFLYTHFPDFFSYYYIILINEIPVTCYQLRNFVLSAVPKSFPTDYKKEHYLKSPSVFMLCPRYFPPNLFKITEQYLKNKEPQNYMKIILAYFENAFRFEQNSHGVDFLNSFIFYMITTGSKDCVTQSIVSNVKNITSLIQFKIIKQIIFNVNSDITRHMVLTAIINNIRFYSTHSQFATTTLLAIYLSISDYNFKEEVLRCVFERLVCHPPYPCAMINLYDTLIRDAEYEALSITSQKDTIMRPIFTRIAKNIDSFLLR